MKNNWQTKKLGEICDILDNQRKPVTQRDRVLGEYPYYGATGIQDYVNKYIFDEKLILVGEDGAKWGSGENTAFMVEGKYWVNNHAHVLRPHREKVLDNWIVYFLNINDLSRYITGLTVQKLNQGQLREIQIPIPPISEQQSVIEILDKVIEKIEKAKKNTEKNIQNSQELFESYLQSIFEYPNKHWKESTLGEVCDLITDGKHGDCENESDSGYYFLSAKDIKNNTLNYGKARQITKKDFEETHRRTNLTPGDVLVTNSGTIGRMAIAPDDQKTYRTTFQKSVAIIKPKCEIMDNTYCCYLLTADLKKLVSVSSGTAQKNLLLGDLRKLIIQFPGSLSEQKQIVKKLDQLSEQTKMLVENYRKKLADLEELKRSILQQAFDPNSEFNHKMQFSVVEQI